jgi:hypothetical protein
VRRDLVERRPRRLPERGDHFRSQRFAIHGLGGVIARRGAQIGCAELVVASRGYRRNTDTRTRSASCASGRTNASSSMRPT